MRTTNENERTDDEFIQKRTNTNSPVFAHFLPIFGQKMGKNGQKTGERKRTLAKPKVSPNLGLGSPRPGEGQGVANCACARRTKMNELLASLYKNKQTRIRPFLPIFCPFLGKKWAKTGKKNGQTKTNPGETGRNRKFRRILVRDRHALVRGVMAFVITLFSGRRVRLKTIRLLLSPLRTF